MKKKDPTFLEENVILKVHSVTKMFLYAPINMLMKCENFYRHVKER